MKFLMKKNSILSLIISLAIISIVSFIWSLLQHNIILYGDATSHLNIARRIIDSKNPGFAQLGSSWLPLFHLLLLPFTVNDFLYRTGIAGYCINSFLFIFTGIFFYKILLFLFPEKKKVCFIVTLLFCLNANMIYFQTTAMGEMLLLFTSTAGIYYLLKYITNTTSTIHLTLAALFVFLSAMNRYEGWFLACAEVAFVFVYILLKDKNYKRAEGKTILFASLALLSIMTWIVYNLAIFHDPLNFIHDTHTAAGQQNILYKQGLLLTKHNLLRSIQTFSFSSNEITGNIFSGLVIISLFWYILKNRNPTYLPIIVLFSSIWIFEILTLYLGITVIYVPQLYPHHLFNIRYALFSYPGFFLLIGVFILSQKRSLFVYLYIFLLFVQNLLLIYPQAPIVIREGRDLFQTDLGMLEAGHYLRDHYTGGDILASAGTIDPLFLFSDIPLREFVYEGNQYLWDDSLLHPENHVQWVVFKAASNNLDFVAKNLENKPEFLRYYRLVTKKKNINIYERAK